MQQVAQRAAELPAHAAVDEEIEWIAKQDEEVDEQGRDGHPIWFNYPQRPGVFDDDDYPGRRVRQRPHVGRHL